MSLPDDETLMRWSDGELSPDAAARLEAAARTDPALAARMEAMSRSRQALAEAFPIAFDPRDADLARRIAAAGAAATPALALAGLRTRSGELRAPRHASEGADERGLSVGLTFQDVDGRWCRTFQSERDGWVGLACRADGAWTVTALAALEASDGEVRMASSETPAAVLAAVDASIAGETADALAETRARDAGWR